MSKLLVAGQHGLVGSALLSFFKESQFYDLLEYPKKSIDFRDRDRVYNFFDSNSPELVIISAAKVGGILANKSFPVDFLSDNLQIQTNLIDACFKFDVNKVIFLGSSCIYPRNCPQPIREEYLLTGELEETNKAYAIAKIAGIELIQSYRSQHGKTGWFSVMPCNLYGPNDDFSSDNSHVIPALIKKFCNAVRSQSPEVEVWGSGKPLREFLHVNDLATSLDILMRHNDLQRGLINVGSGIEISILKLSELIADLCNFQGIIKFDSSKPDGTPRKLLDSSYVNELGWNPSIKLEQGLSKVINDFQNGVK